MDRTKLTVRVPRRLLESAKQYASDHQTTLTELVNLYLQRLAGDEDFLASTPTVRRLSGVLPTEPGEEAYRQYLREKYLDEGSN